MCLQKRTGKQVRRATGMIADFLSELPICSPFEKWEIVSFLLEPLFPSDRCCLLSHAANSSDSEDQSVAEGTAKSTASKNNTSEVKAATSPKCHGRSPPSSHKYHKQGDTDHNQHRENHGRSPRVYKWSFPTCKSHKMSNLRRFTL